MESELCRETLALLQSRGFNIRLHKCYDPSLDIEIVEAEQAKPPNNASTTTSKATNQSPSKRLSPRNKQLLKHPKTKVSLPPRRLCPEPLPETPQTHLPSPTPPTHQRIPVGLPRVVGALVLSQAPPSGGPHRPTIGFSKRSRWIGVGGGFRSPGHIGFSKRSRWAEAAEGEGGFEGMRGRQ